MTSYNDVKESDLKKLKKHGFAEEKKGKDELLRLKGNCSLVLYKTGKLLVQGKKENVLEAEKLIDYCGIAKSTGLAGLAIGTDESLKGDTFGGIVVAGFLADDSIKAELKAMKVKDSKQLTNPEVVGLAQQLVEKYPKNYHVESLLPKEYNKFTASANVTELLDILHLKCYKKLAGKKDIIHIVDLYPGCSVGLVKETKADSRYLEVAAASIIARFEAIKQIRALEMRSGFFIPMGSSNVEGALLEIQKKSLNPADYVKLNFKNVHAFFNR